MSLNTIAPVPDDNLVVLSVQHIFFGADLWAKPVDPGSNLVGRQGVPNRDGSVPRVTINYKWK